MNFTKKLQEDLERAEGLREPVAKVGRVLSEKNLAIVIQCLDALRTLAESAEFEAAPTAKATLIRMYGGIAQDAGLPIARMAAQGDVMAATFLRAALDGTDDEFVSLIRKVRGGSSTGGPDGLDGPARVNPSAVAERVAAQLFKRR